MLKVESLTKFFHNSPAIKDLTFSCEEGQILGVVGPHDSGKSTLLRLLANIIHPDEGSINYKNELYSKYHTERIGYLPEHRALYEKSEVLSFLKYFASLHGLSKHDAEIEAVRFLDRFNLIEHSKSAIENLTSSDVQKLEIIATFIHNPDIIVLDEPFKGLDYKNLLILKSMLFSMRRMGKIIILSSHNLDLVQQISTHILLLANGKEILYGSTGKILEDYTEDSIELTYQDNENVTKYFGDLPEVKDFHRANNITTAYLNDGVSKKTFLGKVNQIIEIEKYEVTKPSLKETVLKIIPQDKFDKDA